ncbi:MAG: WG repeat-containing protein [Crocinitomicaceae bacterium]|nr:WG repeat-containing protein [Crocinitomicaceae bacterium]
MKRSGTVNLVSSDMLFLIRILKMKGIILFALLFPVIGNAQFSLTEKKGRVGVNYGDIVLITPKADSICLSDSVATVFKKKKVSYLNTLGDKIYKSTIEKGHPFHNGFAIIQNKKGLYGAINAQGEEVVPFTSLRPGIYYGNMLLVKRYLKREHDFVLYEPYRSVLANIDSVIWLHDWIIVHRTESEKFEYVKKRLLRQDEVKTEYKYVQYSTVYDPFNYEKVDQSGGYKDFGDYVFFNDPTGKKNLRSVDKSIKIEGINHVQELNENYLQFEQNDNLVLFNRKLKRSLISGNYYEYQFNENSIYAWKDTNGSFKSVAIYDLEGILLRDDLAYVRHIDDNRIVFMLDSMQVIGTEKGEILTDRFYAFGESHNGFRIVYLGASYGYIDESDYHLLPIEYPLIMKHYSGGGGKKPGGIFRAFAQMIGNFGRMMTFQKPKNFDNTLPTYDYTSLSEAGHPFHEGYAKVCLYGLNKDQQYDSLLIVEQHEPLHYNFVDINGRLLNSKKYTDAGNFNGGRTWVKEGKNYYIIDKTGKKVSNRNYYRFEAMKDGYYHATSNSIDYIYNSNFEEVAKCDCWRFHQDESGIYQIKYTDTLAVYLYPSN